MRYCYTLLLFFSVFAAAAQGLPGYVITLTGDTLRGTIQEETNQRHVRLHPAQGATQEFKPSQIRGYGLRGQAMIASEVVKLADGGVQVSFVLPQLVGPASLYTYATETGLLLRAPAVPDTLYELTDINWHVLLNRYLSGCSTLDHTTNQALAMSFTQANLSRVLVQYNQCRDPHWQVGTSPTQVAWAQGLGVRLGYGYAYNQGQGPKLSRGNSRQVALEWTGIRANGVQVSVVGSYTQINLHTDFYPNNPWGNTGSVAQEVKLISQNQLVSLGMQVGRRLGTGRGPGLYLGFGTNFDYVFRATSETQQRPAATQLPITSVYSEPGEGRGYILTRLQASVGTMWSLQTGHDVRLTATYQYYLGSVKVVGAQAAYYIYRR